ncbi:MAG: hypothetical protein JRN68_04105 [Nitrososphaerota archaeon]|jgi:hypothetical protein|nr:hypothetical protein [Nitrososphaerota archaeon]
MRSQKTTVIGEVLQVRMGRRRIELVLAPQDTRPEQKSRRAVSVMTAEEGAIEQEDPFSTDGAFIEPAWSFYLSRTTFEAIGRPTVGCEIMVTLSTIK